VKLIVVGPGRAGGSLAIAAQAAGHEVVGVVMRSPLRWELPFAVLDETWPTADLVVIATRDRDIAEAAQIVEKKHPPTAAVHLSGATSVDVLEPLFRSGWQTGSFHPLQTLPDPISGAGALAGAFVGVTATGELRQRLAALADDLGMTDFDLDDDHKPVYHAGAAAASNFLLAGLDLAEQLFSAAGVPFAAAGPLSAEALDNAYEKGPRQSLTGPIARGDWDTVRSQLRAARALGVDRQFRLLVEATAITAGVDLPHDLD
jgi:predicted short-subunit dehydrogenase-like oxidoreductase (DUF2520 family)